MKTMILKVFLVSLIIIPLGAKSSNQIEKSQICSNGIDQLVDIDSQNHPKIKIALCKTETNNDFKEVYLLDYTKQNAINFFYIDRYYPEGSQAKIKFSFLNSYKNGKELIILVSWKQKVKKIADGELLHVYIYRIQDQLIQRIDNLFQYEFEGIQEGKLIQAKFITKRNIEKQLYKLTNLKSICNLLKKKQTLYSFSILEEILFKIPLTEQTLTSYNNVVHCLQKQGKNQEAIYLLEKILEKYPNRTVAHYNIADGYWAIGKKKKAKKHYKIYIELMKQKGQEKEVPNEVYRKIEH